MKISFEISTSLIGNIVGLIGLLILMFVFEWSFWVYLGIALMWFSLTTITQNLEDQITAMHKCLHRKDHNNKNDNRLGAVKVATLNPEDAKKLIEGLNKNNAKN